MMKVILITTFLFTSLLYSRDTVKPVITMLDDPIITMEYGGTYRFARVTAWDDVDGDISNRIVITGAGSPITFESTQIGTFIHRYNVSDNAGNAADEKTITFHVVDTRAPVFENEDSVTVNENQIDAITLYASDFRASSMTYSISGEDSELFNIEIVPPDYQKKCKLTFKTAPDYETKKVYRFTVKANDGYNISTQDITINIANLPETLPHISEPQIFSISKNAKAGQIVGRVLLKVSPEHIATTGFTLTSNPDNLYTIDLNGVITLTKDMTESNSSLDCTVKASSEQGESSETVIKIILND